MHRAIAFSAKGLRDSTRWHGFVCVLSSCGLAGAGTLAPGSIRRPESIAAVRFVVAITVVDLSRWFSCRGCFSRCGPEAYGPHWPRLPPPASPAPTGLACPHQPRLLPSASPSPIGLACPHRPRLPHGKEEGSSQVLGIGLRLWQSALGFPSLSFIYKSIVFLLFVSTDNSSSSLFLHHLLVSTQWKPVGFPQGNCTAPTT
jgi:hypothetical protein